MLIAWLVLSKRWDVFGNPDDGLPSEFASSIILAAFEIACEFYWIVRIFA